MTSTTTEVDPDTGATRKLSNDDRKRDKLTREIVRADEWRTQVWAQCELRIQQAAAQLEVLGGEVPVLMDKQFDDPEMLHHYSTMSLTK